MSLDLTTLRLLKHRERYERLARNVPTRALEPAVALLFTSFGHYFEEFPDVATVQTNHFMTWFAMRNKGLKDEAKEKYTTIMRSVVEEADPTLEAGIMKRLVAAATAYDMAVMIEKFNAGDDIDLRTGVESLMTKYDELVDRKIKNPQVLDPIEDLLKDEENDKGLHWRLDCLNKHIKPIVPGDFIVVAARPDKGKTTFAASELTCMAAQVDALWPGEQRSILWFNNEGPGRRIVTRCFQAALGATIEQLVEKSNAGTIREEYKAALGGRGGTLRIFDIHGMWNHEVEDLIRIHKPALCLWDMIDNVRFGGDVANNGQRTDQLLEAMYGWVRMMGVKYDCAMMAMSQISADGDGLQWPTLPMLKDSKTGKQGAADVIITLGTVNDPMLSKSRYIGTTKNKKVRTGIPGSPMTEVLFDGDRARYVEIDQ